MENWVLKLSQVTTLLLSVCFFSKTSYMSFYSFHSKKKPSHINWIHDDDDMHFESKRLLIYSNREKIYVWHKHPKLKSKCFKGKKKHSGKRKKTERKTKHKKVEQLDVDVQVIMNCSFMEENVYKTKKHILRLELRKETVKSSWSWNVFMICLTAKVYHLNCLWQSWKNRSRFQKVHLRPYVCS